MAATFRPRLDILPEPQRRLWPELAELPKDYVLYGGTAIALHLGHRDSIDFDFFISKSIDPRRLLDDLPILQSAKVTQLEPETLSVTIDRGGPIKLSFFGVPKLGCVRHPVHTDDIGLAVADLLDLSGTKVSVVQVRAEAKDYIDIGAMLLAGLTLPQMLSAGLALYGTTFTPQTGLKSLCYFDEPNLATLPVALKDRLREAVKVVDVNMLPDIQAIAPRTQA